MNDDTNLYAAWRAGRDAAVKANPYDCELQEAEWLQYEEGWEDFYELQGN